MSVITVERFKEGHVGIKRKKFETMFVGVCRVIPIQITPTCVRLAVKAPRSVSITRDDAKAGGNPQLCDDDAMDVAFAAVDAGIGFARTCEPEDLVGNLDAVAAMCRALLVLSGSFTIGAAPEDGQ